MSALHEQSEAARVDLYWLPLGAGDTLPWVRWNGRLFEALAAWRQGRPPRDLNHAALEVRLDGARFVIELAPAWGAGHTDHGMVGEGPVGLTWLGRSRFFRYEVRRWRDGLIPDLAEAVGGPQRLADDAACAQRVLDLVPAFPTATWGRDEFGTGDMWNSNSLIAWLLARGGVNTDHVEPPPHGRAPGWWAGVVVAERQERQPAERTTAIGDSSHPASVEPFSARGHGATATCSPRSRPR